MKDDFSIVEIDRSNGSVIRNVYSLPSTYTVASGVSAYNAVDNQYYLVVYTSSTAAPTILQLNVTAGAASVLPSSASEIYGLAYDVITRTLWALTDTALLNVNTGVNTTIPGIAFLSFFFLTF